MNVVIGADPWGVELKETVREHLIKKADLAIIDIGGAGCEDDEPYFQIAAKAAQMIQAGEADKAVLFCGTGMGVAIVANKFKGIYAAVIESEFTARMAKAVNNANVLTMGSMVLSAHIACLAVDAWLETAHTQGLEEYQDFLCGAVEAVRQIETDSMK